MPDWTLFNGIGETKFRKFSSLSRLSFPQGRHLALGDEEDSANQREPAFLPDQRLMCFDSLYHVVEDAPWEWGMDYSPAWNVVGKHLHFHPAVLALASEYLKRLFGVNNGLDLPQVRPKFL